MAIKTIFLDRDGVINKEIHYLHKINDLEFVDGIFDVCIHFQNLGYQNIIITNQSGIGRGYYEESDYQKITNWMLSKFNGYGVKILDIFHCPHAPDSNCNCRKPKPGMLLNAKTKYGIDMKRSWLIGDKETDIQAANNAGINQTILIKSGYIIDELKSNARYIINKVSDSAKIITT